MHIFRIPNQLEKRKDKELATSYIYSINLVDIPVVILDKTTTIRIEKQYHSWKHKK